MWMIGTTPSFQCFSSALDVRGMSKCPCRLSRNHQVCSRHARSKIKMSGPPNVAIFGAFSPDARQWVLRVDDLLQVLRYVVAALERISRTMTDAPANRPTTEQDDIRTLISVLHQDRQAAKDKEQRDGWTKYVSLMIVGLAVATAIGSLKSAGLNHG